MVPPAADPDKRERQASTPSSIKHYFIDGFDYNGSIERHFMPSAALLSGPGFLSQTSTRELTAITFFFHIHRIHHSHTTTATYLVMSSARYQCIQANCAIIWGQGDYDIEIETEDWAVYQGFVRNDFGTELVGTWLCNSNDHAYI